MTETQESLGATVARVTARTRLLEQAQVSDPDGNCGGCRAVAKELASAAPVLAEALERAMAFLGTLNASEHAIWDGICECACYDHQPECPLTALRALLEDWGDAVPVAVDGDTGAMAQGG